MKCLSRQPHTALPPAQTGFRRCRALSRAPIRVQAAVLNIPHQYSQVQPKGDLVLIAIARAEEKTTGGVLLPSAAQRKPTSGDIVSVGDGRSGTQTREFTTKPGDTVLYSKFGIGATDLSVQGKDLTLMREDDLIGIMPRSNATAADIPEMKPLGDRVLIKVEEVADVTAGGLLLPDSARDKPVSGKVVRTGPGKMQEDNTRKAPCVAAGDRVLYFKYAGDNMETPSGEKFVVVHESDILCKAN